MSKEGFERADAGPPLVVVLGPTASGKTALAVALARRFGGEILSADSRQVYKGLDIGTGKDLDEYARGGPPVPVHLVDLAEPSEEYSVYRFLDDFREAFRDVTYRRRLPILAGGSGLYLEAVLEGYALAEAPRDEMLRRELEGMTDGALRALLRGLGGGRHNTTDLRDRERILRAIEVAKASSASRDPVPQPFRPLLIGVRWPRDVLRRRVADRLRARLEEGLVEEVEGLAAGGVSWERLDRLGLEYRYVALFLRGRIKNRNDLFQKLRSAIIRFSRKQGTWFRRMERKGARISWIEGGRPEEAGNIVSAFLGGASMLQST